MNQLFFFFFLLFAHCVSSPVMTELEGINCHICYAKFLWRYMYTKILAFGRLQRHMCLYIARGGLTAAFIKKKCSLNPWPQTILADQQVKGFSRSFSFSLTLQVWFYHEVPSQASVRTQLMYFCRGGGGCGDGNLPSPHTPVLLKAVANENETGE